MSSKLKYIPSLDGYRSIGAILIISHHLPLVYYKLPFAFAWQSLQVFFVISGYLITKILLMEKEEKGFGGYIKSFYAKRAYRIFPLYYAFLLFWVLLFTVFGDVPLLDPQAYSEIMDRGIFLFTYTYNFKEWFDPQMGMDGAPSFMFSHLWSLSLEEQFYFIFPFFVYFLSLKNLKRLIVAIIVLTPVIRIIGYQVVTGINDNAIWHGLIMYRSSIFQMDSLTFGAALAVFNFDWLKHPKRWFYILLVFCVALIIFNGYHQSLHEGISVYEALMHHTSLLHNGQYIYLLSLVNLISLLLVLSSVRGNSVTRLFDHPWAVKVGKWTYGIYVYHFAVMMIFPLLMPFYNKLKNHIHPFAGETFMFGAYVVCLLGFSYLSYRYFETPFLKIKDRIK